MWGVSVYKMKTAEQLRIDYYKKIMEDENIVNILEELTETLYKNTREKDEYHLHKKYSTNIAKKVAFCLRFLGYNVIEYKHGKLEAFIK